MRIFGSSHSQKLMCFQASEQNEITKTRNHLKMVRFSAFTILAARHETTQLGRQRDDAADTTA